MTKIYCFALLIVFLISCNAIKNLGDSPLAEEKTAPFSQVDFRADQIFVTIDYKEYQWLKLDTLEVSNIKELFEENYDNNWKKRMSEDLVEYLNKLNIYPKKQEAFTLKNDNGEVISLLLKFNEKKRELAKEHFESTYDKDIDINLLLSKQEAIADINQLQNLIHHKYSYYFLNDVNLEEEIQLLKDGLEPQISTYDLALRIGQLLNKFGDGHTRIHNVNFKENGTLPFSVNAYDGKVVCSKDGKLLSDDHPYLHSINGISVSQLLATSEEYLASDASPQFKEYLKVSRLSRIGEILRLNGSIDNELTIYLASEEGETTSITQYINEYKSGKDLSRAQIAQLMEERNNYDPFEVKHFDNIGYLKIKSMEALSGKDAKQLPLNDFEKSKGLIIDVRNNGGGMRDILLELAPHLISEEQGFVVGNVARLRTNKPSKNHDLSDRYLYQMEDEYFAEDAKSKIKAWTKHFTPSVTLDENLYTPNYYLLIESHENPKFAHIPIVVLMNEGCFSATDIFLSTLKEIDNVTLIGTASGGGSGRSKRYRLDHSLIEFRLSSIVSYQPNGDLYDGIGVHPDIEVMPSGISDILNETDSQLDYALNFLKEKWK
ncbi:S41 family peptidase [Portibacter lacus]|uniref:Peptidase S41 n=1 Tax=Portibacter lacus TaxID=1099794 RepID=A0AA37WIA8_9BACT|nr:S41 family peptidase [Portibacter lacus]GLR19545.1 peptidase S41 [Portibacter lacus]